MKNCSALESEAQVSRAYEAGVERIVAVAGSDTPGDFVRTLEIASRHPPLSVAVGVHPHASSEYCLAVEDKIRFALDNPKVVALGEIGLDYHYNFSEQKTQRAVFVKQLRIAGTSNKKVIIHMRKAEDDALSILRDEGASGGVIHCFSSGAKFAEGALSLGFFLSFSGIVTFPKADDIREIARSMPMERMLAETDSPYLAPVPHRGKTNEPAYVRNVVEKLAELRNEKIELVADALFANALRCFDLR
jgi:TatD DNase family protein